MQEMERVSPETKMAKGVGCGCAPEHRDRRVWTGDYKQTQWLKLARMETTYKERGKDRGGEDFTEGKHQN